MKSDDDVAVDTLHLDRFVSYYIEEANEGEPFILCDPVPNYKPHR